MNRVQTVIDGVIVYDSGAVPTPPPGGTPPPVTPPPTGGTPPPTGVLPFPRPGQSRNYVTVAPGEVQCWQLPVAFPDMGYPEITGGSIVFGNQPPYTTQGTLWEAVISRSPGDFSAYPNGGYELGSAGGGPLSWVPHGTTGYGVQVIPPGEAEQWFLSVRVKADSVGACALAPNGKCGLVFNWSPIP
jgi:hypothetical protein